MSSENNNITKMLEGLEQYFSTKTVVGEPIRVDNETIIVPLMEVSFGMGNAVSENDKKNSQGGGMGAKMNPTAMLVCSKGKVKMVNVKPVDSMSKIVDMVPDILNRFKKDDNVTIDSDVTDSEK